MTNHAQDDSTVLVVGELARLARDQGVRRIVLRFDDGGNESLTDGVQRALGREPLDFSDNVRDTAATGVWIV